MESDAVVVEKVEKNKKNWAKGSRQDFLTAHFAGFQSALLISRSRTSEFVDTVGNESFQKYHWSLPTTSEPESDPLHPRDPAVPEVLTEEEKTLKQQVIVQTKAVRVFIDCYSVLSNSSLFFILSF